MIELEVNNGGTMKIVQEENKIKVITEDENFNISDGDVVMLINYYRYVKDNNIKCSFINYYGINKIDD